MVSQPNDVTVPAVDASVYKMSFYHLPLIAPLAASRVGNGPQKLQEGHLDEKTNLAASRAGHASPEATGRHLYKEKTHQHLALPAR